MRSAAVVRRFSHSRRPRRREDALGVQPTGGKDATTTENGCYDMAGTNESGMPPARNAINPNTSAAPTFFPPTEDRWYKAAYYRGGSTHAGYRMYATQGDDPPTNNAATATTSLPWANSLHGVTYCTTQSAIFATNQKLPHGRRRVPRVRQPLRHALPYGTS